MTFTVDESEREELEIRLLLEGIFHLYGFDFRDYAPAFLKRRILNCLVAENLKSVSGLQERILNDCKCMERLLRELCIPVTAIFRDPHFWVAFRKVVVPMLGEHSFIRVWHPGCSTGEEVYSMAILLKEERLYSRCRIYATDLHEAVLKNAKTGVFPISAMKSYSSNYLQAGGWGSLSDYYSARYNRAIFSSSLKENLVFGEHNLVSDASFNEFQIISCRNVLIYFGKSLRKRILGLLHDSMAVTGVLCLGDKESLQFSGLEGYYREVVGSARIYQRIR